MKSQVLLDTGPLLALLDCRQEHHAWASEQIKRLTPPLITCGAVLSEAMFLLRKHAEAMRSIRHFLRARIIQMELPEGAFADRVLGLMETYFGVPMSYADACLVAMAEQRDRAAVFTLDRHFQIYRMNRNLPVPVIMPE